jgi:riboflavin transporter
MPKIKDLFIASVKEFKDVRCITLAAMFGAFSIILARCSIQLTQSLKIEWTFLPNEFIYYLFGPFVGAFFGTVMDVLGYFVKPDGAFFPGFTISAILKGLLFGFLLYKRKISLKRLLLVNVIRAVFIDFLLNTYWLAILYGTPYVVMLPARGIKILIMLPVETYLFYLLVKGVEATGILKIIGRSKDTFGIKVK